MPTGEPPRLRLALQLTEPEIQELEGRPAADSRPVDNYVAMRVAATLSRPPKRFRPMPTHSARRRFTLALPMKYMSRESLEKRAERAMRCG